jgi:hypothetical protein
MRRSDRFIIDWSGSLKIERDHNGGPIERLIDGNGKPDVWRAELIFVRDAMPDEPPEVSFDVDSFRRDFIPYRLQYTDTLRIDRASVETAGFESIDAVSGRSRTPENLSRSVDVAIDPRTAEPVDAVTPDGDVTFNVGPGVQVVLVLEHERRVIKGTQRQLLDAERGILDAMKIGEPNAHQALDRIRSAIEEFDPSSGVLFLSLNPFRDPLLQVEILPHPEQS